MGLGDAYTRLVQVLAVGNLMAEEVERQGDTSHKHHWRGMLPTVRTLANLTASEDPRMLQAVLDAGVLPELNKCLMGLASKRLKKEACWLVSMVAAGEPQQRELLVKHDMLATLVFLIEYAEYDVVMEACFAFTNFLHGATPEQIKCVSSACRRVRADGHTDHPLGRRWECAARWWWTWSASSRCATVWSRATPTCCSGYSGG